MDILIGLLVVLAIVTLIGHGVWVLCAAILRALFGSGAHPEKPMGPPTLLGETVLGTGLKEQCPVCTAPFPTPRSQCNVCGWPRRTPAPEERRSIALDAVRRTVARFQRLKWLEPESLQRVNQALDDALEPNIPLGSADEASHVAADVAMAPAAPPHQPVETLDELTPLELVDDEPPRAKPAAPPPLRPATEVPVEIPLPADGASIPLKPVSAAHTSQEVADDSARRAARFAAARSAVPVNVGPSDVGKRSYAPTEPPAKPLSKIFASFLEEKNIRWGELIGGLLIICSSIALVLSFWQQISDRPVLKFGLFNGVTAALFGIGLYIERRWRLPTTTQGILLIAVLLVPLNFLAIAAVTLDQAPNDAASIAGELLSIAVFAVCTFAAGRSLVGPTGWQLAAGVMCSSVLELVVRRVVGTESSTGALLTLGLLPVLSFALPTIAWARRLDRDAAASANGVDATGPTVESLGETDVNRLFKVIGTTLFAAVMPLGLLLAKAGDTSATLARIAPLLSLLGAPLLVAGLVLWRKLTAPEMMKERVAGTAVATAGALAMLAAVAFGWPMPAGMLPTALINGIVFVWAAVRSRIPAAHLPAALCFTAAYLLGFHVARGGLAWEFDDPRLVFDVLLSAISGTALVAPAVVFGLVALVCRRGAEAGSVRRETAQWYGMAGGAAAFASIALVAYFALGVTHDEAYATWVFALYALMAIAAGAVTGKKALGYAGSALGWAALLQGFCFRYGGEASPAEAWTWVVLVHATVSLVGMRTLVGWSGTSNRNLREGAATPLFVGAVITAALAVPTLVYLAARGDTHVAAIGFTWLAALWGLIAWYLQTGPSFAAFQAAGFAAVILWTHRWLERQDWFNEIVGYPRVVDPRALATYGLATAAVCGVWLAARLLLKGALPSVETMPDSPADSRGGPSRWTSAVRSLAQFVYVSSATVDRLVLAGLVLLVAWLATSAIVPGVRQELAPAAAVRAERVVPPLAKFELFGIAHGGAHGPEAWLLVGAVALLVGASLWERFAFEKLLWLLVAATAAMLLGAARWETEVAAASAVRWGGVLEFALLSLPLWFRGATIGVVDRLGWPAWNRREAAVRTWWFAWSLGLSLAPAIFVHGALIVAALGRLELTLVTHIGLVALLVVGVATLVITALVDTARFSAGRSSWSMLGARLFQLSGLVLIAAVVLYDVATAFATSRGIIGPDASSFFAELGVAKSYVVPLVALAGVLIVHAYAAGSAGMALGAGLLLNLSATIGYLLHAATKPGMPTGLTFDLELWLRLGQLNAAVAAGFAIAWMTLVLARRKPAESDAAPTSTGPTTWLTTQAALAAALIAPAILGPVAVLCADLYDPTRVPPAVADLPAWGAFAAVLAAVVMWFRTAREPISAAAWNLAALGVVTLAALATIPHVNGDLVTFDLLVAGWLAVAFASALVGYWAERRGWPYGPAAAVRRWAMVIGLAAVVGAQYGVAVIALQPTVPNLPPTPHAFLSATPFLFALLCIGLAAWGAQRSTLYAAAIAISYGVVANWNDDWEARWLPESVDDGGSEVFVFFISWALPTPLWLWIERRFVAKSHDGERTARMPALSRFTALSSWAAITLCALAGLGNDLDRNPIATSGLLYGLAIGSMFVAVLTLLWDAGAKRAVPMAYLAGLTVLGATLDAFDIAEPRLLFWTGMMFTAAYALGTSYLWSRRAGLCAIGLKLGMPIERWSDADDGTPAGQRWLVAANLVLAVGVSCAAFGVILRYDDFRLRIGAAHAVFGAAAAVALLARGARRSSLQLLALSFGWGGAIAVAWSPLEPGAPGEFLNRAVLAVTATAAVIVLYGLGFSKLLREENDWTAAARRLVPRLIVLAGLGLALVLGAEIYEYFTLGEVQISGLAIGAVAVALVGLVAAAITAALVPGRDPLGLSERGRMNYVYGAEAILALSFLHVRLTMPWLFSGFWLRYWPVLVMVLAFGGVGLAEVFRRRKTNVLAEPLERTGAFLPLLPVFGFWVTNSEVHYSLLLLAVGALYSTLAVMRKSFGFGIVAALAANGGLWYFLGNQEGLQWDDHPQLWLIPPALCVLIAAHLNRSRLTVEQMTGYRYASAATIYVASTADVFLNGVAEAPLLPLWLAALAIAGIFAGIALRVRAFLFLGTAFLTLALLTIIWHAAYDLEQTWIFYVAGIVSGVLIIALFAVFEKKRQEILSVVEKLREWDS